MNYKSKSIIVIALLLSLVSSKSFAKDKHLIDTLKIQKGLNYLVLDKEINDCKLLGKSYKYTVLDNILKLDANNGEDDVLFISYKDKSNSIIHLSSSKGESMIDLRGKIQQYPDNYYLQYRFYQLNSGNSYFNISDAKKTFKNIVESSNIKPLSNYNKSSEMIITLTNYKKNFQGKWYSFNLFNTGDETFHPSIIEVTNLNNEDEIIPIGQVFCENVESDDFRTFSFVIDKKIKEEFLVKIKDTEDESRTVLIQINSENIKRY